MSWRPKGWKNPLTILGYKFKDAKVYEAGADAMLLALKKQGEARTRQGVRGYSVFIPDGDSKDGN